MADFSKLIITDKGKELLNKEMLLDGPLEFTKITISSRQYEEEEISSLEELGDVRQEKPVRKVTVEHDAVAVDFMLSNEELAEGYFIRSIGLSARQGDGEDILFAAAAEKSGGSYMPKHSETVTSLQVKLRFRIDNVRNVKIVVDAGGTATMGDVLEIRDMILEEAERAGTAEEQLKKQTETEAERASKKEAELEEKKLDKAGGEMTGRLFTQAGSSAISLGGVNGTRGYLQAIDIEYKGNNYNSPFIFEIVKRQREGSTVLYVSFIEVNVAEPPLVLKYTGYNYNVVAVNISTNLWRIFIPVTTNDRMEIVRYHPPAHSPNKVNFYKNVVVPELPEGTRVAATPTGTVENAHMVDGKHASDLMNYNNLTNKPSIPPAVAVKGSAESSYRTGNVNITAANIGLGNVDNTTDMGKPVSAAQQSALDSYYQQSSGYTDKKIADLIGGAPATLDTLGEIAKAMKENESVVAALDAAIGKKAGAAEFDSHVKDTTAHVTAAERNNWNSKAGGSHTHDDRYYTEAEINVKLGGKADSGHTHNYNDLLNKPTIPSVGNGTVTIKQNGVNKGTFTLNQSGNTTIELSDTDTNTHLLTGVKGSAESSYRTGNVNITAANIGLGNVNNTADANKSVKYANSAGSVAYANVSGRPTFSLSGTTLTINF